MKMEQAAPLALLNARLVDPAADKVLTGGVLVVDGRIVGCGPEVRNAPENFHVFDCRGLCLAPGLIDAQAFVGEPGFEYRETIATATRAAAAGGVTTILSRTDTQPAVDDPAIVDFLARRARDTGVVRLAPMAALTRGRAGVEIAEIGLLKEAGAVAFGDGPRSLRNAQVMRRAMVYARDFDVLVVHFPQDDDLAEAGVINPGELATRLGLPTLPPEAESVMLERDIRLVEMTGARYHAALVSCEQSLEILSRAKAKGLPVTAGVSINHLTLNENDIGDYRTFLKLRPPLRSESERRALVAALADGLIDVIVSDHDPQDVEAKRLPFSEAEFGAIGVETMLSAGLRLVHAGDLTLNGLIRAMTLRPAEIFRLPQGRLEIGAPADLVAFDPDAPFVVAAESLHSQCQNTPFDEARLQGEVVAVLVAGVFVRPLGEALSPTR